MPRETGFGRRPAPKAIVSEARALKTWRPASNIDARDPRSYCVDSNDFRPLGLPPAGTQ
jgi:hypothetical protein